MYRSIPTKAISLRTQAPLAFALALALGQSAAPARAGALMDHADPIGPMAASRFNTGLKMGEQKAVLARQFARRNPPLPLTAHRPAGTVVVANCDDSGAGSLREALATAASGDVIDLTALTCSTISLSSGQLTVAVDDLAVRGPGAEQLVIDGNSDSRILAHTGYGLLDIDGVSLRNGNYAYTGPVLYSGLAAGGCLLSTGNVTLTNSKIENCSAAGTSVSGAAIDAHGRLIMTDSTVSGVSATATSNEISATIYGGAVYAAASYLTRATISDATVSASATTAFSGAFGGGIFSLYGVVLTDSRISGVSVDVSAAKIAYAKGGGIGTPRTVVMSGSTVADNSVRGTPGAGASGAYTYISAIGGGGVYIASIPRGVPPASSITGSTISGNSATCSADIGQYTVGGGGGIATWSPARLAIVNSTISGNSAATMGGGLYSRHFGAFGLSNSTVTDNTAPDGSGVADQGEEWPYDFSTLSSLVAGNHATGAKAFEITTLHTIGGANNLIASANVALPPGTLSGDPMLAPLADNGGPTRTHALLPESPAIDQGSNPDNLASDQRGATFLRVFGNSTDIGSYELQPLPELIFANGFD